MYDCQVVLLTVVVLPFSSVLGNKPPAAARKLNLGPALASVGAAAAHLGVLSDCHFSVQLNRFIPVFRSYSVPVFLK